jgi:hypothetical protein
VEPLPLLLDWALEQGMSIRGLLTLEQLAELRRVFCAGAPWSFELYEPLRALTHAAARLELPDLPARIHFGDALTALDQVLVRDAVSGAAPGLLGDGLRRYGWSIEHHLTPDVFAELGYARTSAGISALRGKHRAGWQAHADANRKFVLSACTDAEPGALAVLGAGKLYDVPLKRLTERFERVLLVDVDAESLAESTARVLNVARSNVELVTAELTGVAGFLVTALRDLFDGSSSLSEDGAHDSLLALLYSFRTSTGASALAQALGARPPLAVCVSTMLLSQLAAPLTGLIEARFKQRFPFSRRLQQPRFQIALGQFSHRVQHAHLQALLGSSRLALITSDVSEQPTYWSPRGAEPASAPLPLIGAPRLDELLPRARVQITRSASWQWPRVMPSARRPHGRLLEVNGCAATTSAR